MCSEKENVRQLSKICFEFEAFLFVSVILNPAHVFICNDSIENPLGAVIQTAKSILKLVLMKSCVICGITINDWNESYRYGKNSLLYNFNRWSAFVFWVFMVKIIFWGKSSTVGDCKSLSSAQWTGLTFTLQLPQKKQVALFYPHSLSF